MNKPLKPVFEFLLPSLEEAKIDYWVFGGLSVAAYIGRFIRNNKDVDIFVKNIDFFKAKKLLDDLCRQNDFKVKSGSQKNGERPKIEIEIDTIERFSMIPIYQEGDMVIFKYNDGDQKYPNDILKKVERNISGFNFITSQDKFIKEMFINHIEVRPDKKNREKIMIDARAILSFDERFRLGFPVD